MLNIYKSKYFEIILLLIIFLLSFVSFNHFFNNTESGGYYQNIIAALMGTIFTVVITSFLLKQQVRSEELREQNVEVFKKKVEKYETLIALLNKVVEDGVVDHAEAILIKKSIYETSLFCGTDILSLVASFLKQEVIGNIEEDGKITIFDITSSMRKELHLEGITTFDNKDLKPIELLINSNFELLPLYKNINNYLYKLLDDINLIFCDMDNIYETTVIEVLNDHVSFTIKHVDAKELDFFIIQITFPQKREKRLLLEFDILCHSGELHFDIDEQNIIKAAKLGMEYTIDEDQPTEINGYKFHVLNVDDKDNIKSNNNSLANTIVKDIIDIESILFNRKYEIKKPNISK